MTSKLALSVSMCLAFGACSESRNDHDVLEDFIGIEICEEAVVTETTKPENVSAFRFDVVYEFEVIVDEPCLTAIFDRIAETNVCTKYPDQLSCDYEGGDTVFLYKTENGILVIYAT